VTLKLALAVAGMVLLAPSLVLGQRGAAGPSLTNPTAAALAAPGPDSFDVAFYTTKGPFTARIRRSWAPRGSDRAFHAISARYYDEQRFFRAIPGFMVQWGFHGVPKVNDAWDSKPIRDDPPKGSNVRGTLTFATRGPGSRTVQLFVNRVDNKNLDALGFVPIGEVTDSMLVVDAIYSGYGEGAPRGLGPDQGLIAMRGNAYLKQRFPELDSIDSARVIRRWPEAATSGRSGKP
jgi:peptidyl-prolyl cis-trans isomerase A (cyclophilin A)